MEKIIQKIKSDPYLSVIIAIILGWAVILMSKSLAGPVVKVMGSYITLNFYTKNVIFKLFMLLLSIAAILLINRGKLENYGFTRVFQFKFLKTTLITTGIVIASIITGNIIFNVVLKKLFPSGNTTGFPEHQSIIEMILTIWIWSSICEEVLVRGLVQSFIQHINFKLFSLSVPVIVSGLFFGSMHLMLLWAGMGLWFVCSIVFFTTTVGLLAAYYREKTGSLVPAIWIHMVANMVGSLPLLVMALIEFVNRS